MLIALLRTVSVIALLCGTACSFGSAPNIGQSSGTSTRKKVDAGAGRVTTASGNVQPDAEAEPDAANSDASVAPAAAGKGGAGGKPSTTTKNNAGAGGAKPDQNEPKDSEPPPEQEEPETQEPSAPADAGNTSPSDAGAQLPPLDAAVDAGPRPTVDNPFGVLGDLAQRTAGGKTAATIDQFLETLANGDAPAASIREFLLAIDDEIDCVMNPFATECLAACQAVSTTCAVCVFDEMCRTTMLEICGYSALAGCVPRR
jgi:hypothetical protein